MEKYTSESFINTGFGGTVNAATHNGTGMKVAIKEMTRTGPNAWSAAREVYFAKRLRHENIIVTHEIIESDKAIYLIQELADMGDLCDYLQPAVAPMNEEEMKSVFRQVVSAVEYIHAKGYCHRDLKPENVVLFNKDGQLVAKVIDFGLAETTTWVSGRVGSNGYAAPEIAAIKPGEIVDGKPADIFSLGVLLFALVTGRMCWKESCEADPQYALYLKEREAGTPGACFGLERKGLDVAKNLCALLDAMLDPDPTGRPTAAQVLNCLSLPWVGPTAKDQECLVEYVLAHNKDSGCSWGDLDDESEALDFNSFPLPCFDGRDENNGPITKTDSAVC